MELSSGKRLYVTPEFSLFLNRSVFTLRWVTIAVLLLLTMMDQRLGRGGLPSWALVGVYAAYTLLADLAAESTPWLRPLGHRVLLDLPVAGLIYFMAAEPGSPLFVPIFLAVVCAAVGLKLRDGLVYTALAVCLTLAIEATSPGWVLNPHNIRDMATRVILLSLAGVGAAALTWRLSHESAAARSAQDEQARLEELDRRKSNFISTVSHDLRTPFTALRAGFGMVRSSVSDRLRPDERELLDDMERTIERLGMSINDLVTFNQLEAGVLRIDLQPLDFRAVVTNAIVVVHPLMQEKEQLLEVDLPEALPGRGDARKLEQVLVNLLDNAHQYTPAGTRIMISGRRRHGDVLLAVTDQGPGIPPEECERIFQRFHRLDRMEPPPSKGGWGMGLPIARAIVEMHGGQIWAESPAGQGCTFYVRLPASQVLGVR
jgi:signal transduction histidine kinase